MKEKFKKFTKMMGKEIIKFIKSEFFAYLVFGGLTTLVSIAVYWLASDALAVNGNITPFGIAVANVISWVLAVAFAYVTNKFFVFKSKSLNPKLVLREAASFVSARLFSLVVEEIWLLSTTYFGMNDKLSKVIGQVFVVIINYVLSKLFIFKKDKNDKSDTNNKEKGDN